MLFEMLIIIIHKLYNNELLDQAQQSSLGVELGKDLIVSAVGQADDTAFLSDDLLKLLLILQLAMDYCEKYNVVLSPSKTKLRILMASALSQFVKNRNWLNPLNTFYCAVQRNCTRCVWV